MARTFSLHYSDNTDDLLTVLGLFSHFFAIDTTVAERQFFQRLAQLIGTRAARLSACGIAAIVSKMGYLEEGGCGVATDGSLYNKYPKFADRIHEALVDIFGEKGKTIRTYAAEGEWRQVHLSLRPTSSRLGSLCEQWRRSCC